MQLLMQNIFSYANTYEDAGIDVTVSLTFNQTSSQASKLSECPKWARHPSFQHKPIILGDRSPLGAGGWVGGQKCQCVR